GLPSGVRAGSAPRDDVVAWAAAGISASEATAAAITDTEPIDCSLMENPLRARLACPNPAQGVQMSTTDWQSHKWTRTKFAQTFTQFRSGRFRTSYSGSR